MDIEKKLEEYRKSKQKSWSLNLNFISKKTEDKETTKELLSSEKELSPTESNNSIDDDADSVDDSLNCLTFTDILYYALCFLLWFIIYVIFIKLQFGTVFLVVSCLVGIYVNTRTSPKKKGEVSAYSVFNKDCKSIDGTLKAEQFEKEIRFGPRSF